MSSSRSLQRARALVLPLLAALGATLLGPALLSTAASTASAAPATATEGRVLSNGCSYSPRGIPSCGALMGAAYGANSDPAPWEASMGAKLGVHRTFFQASQVSGAVKHAIKDHANGRVPWMSFKMPHSWSAMASGQGDAWVKDLAARMKQLDGPVWIAFHHEPEKEGNIKDWIRMQERLGPILRNNAPNVGFSVIVTGWNQLYGPAEYRLEAMWPDTKVDIAGFDVYNKYGTAKKGGTWTVPTDMEDDYFVKFKAFAQQRGMAWGLAETAHNDPSFKVDPTWVQRTYNEMTRNGGVAFAYFNTTLHSVSTWRLGTGAKEDAFAKALRGTPTLAGDYTATPAATEENVAQEETGAGTATEQPAPSSTPAGDVALVGVETVNTNSTSFTVPVPAGTAAGDLLLLFASEGNADPLVGPGPGWTRLGRVTDSSHATTVWSKPATGSDRGKTVTLDAEGRWTKAALTLVAYRGADPTNPVAAVSGDPESGTTRNHTTPVVSSTAPVHRVSYWSDKTSSTTAWAKPAGDTLVASTTGSGGGRIGSLLTHHTDLRPAGKHGGLVASANAPASKATSWTLLISPAG